MAVNRIPVVSGLALGIDTAAHEGVLAGGGRTAAVLGCGADRIYPGSNRKLARSILESGGALISEYSPGTLPLRHHFPERNRLISGLCRKAVIVQAPARSGALITADYALEQNRDCCVMSCGLEGPAGEGTLKLFLEGAPVIRDLGDLLRDEGAADAVNMIQESPWPESGTEWAAMLLAELDGRLYQGYGGICRDAM
jgi:DNA processing protein